MNYLFDSDTLSFYYDASRNPEHELVKNRALLLTSQDTLQTSELVMCEFEYSFSNVQGEKKEILKNTIQRIRDDFEIYTKITHEISHNFGEIKVLLKEKYKTSRKNMKMHNIDILLASTAIANNCVLVGSDVNYKKIAKVVPEFNYEDWLL
ncbi:hypothetical protein HON22_05890 [Candidatus Peregrinibacteria bacterium]|jgi:predicted nucleic acid-binding protein|nr:hypothetical protein [Candidatus Peregrinibacteria bacterium]